jgi:aspartate/methionine/tyrosine aminotransferase
VSDLLSKRASSISPSIIRVMSRMRKESSVDLSLGQPKLNPDPEILERAHARFRSTPSQGYTDTGGMMELRERIALHHGFDGRSAGTNVIVTVGSEEAVFLALMASVDAGSEVLMPYPGYPAYPGIARLIGAEAVGYPITRETGLVARAAEIERRITPRTRAIVLNSPSNPFGTIDEEADLRAIAALADRHGLVLISDEIYRDIAYGERPVSIATMSDRVLFVCGLSKSCAMTGMRIGYLIGPESFVTPASLSHQLMVTCAATWSQLAAIEIFREPDHLRRHLPYYEEARRAVIGASAALPATAKLHVGEGAFYAIVDVEAYAAGDPMKLALELVAEEDVIVVPGNAFGPGGDWFWRLSYASGAEAAAEGVRRIGRFLGRRAR